MFQKEQKDCGNGLHDDLLVAVDIDAQFHGLHHRHPEKSYLTLGSRWFSSFLMIDFCGSFGNIAYKVSS